MIFKPLAICAFAILTPTLAAFPAEKAIPTASVARLQKAPPDDPERMEMVKVQIVLDRAKFRPGKIDGLGGEFTQKAADRYAMVHGLPEGQRIDTSSLPQAYVEYTVTEKDLEWVGRMASRPEEQATLKRLPYADSWEAIAEKFHTDLGFLKELNPALEADPKPGDVLRVPDVEPFEMIAVAELEKKRREEKKQKKGGEQPPAESEEKPDAAGPAAAPEREPVLSIVLLREPRLIEIYEDDRLVGCFPCTPGSEKFPVPEGTWKITSNTLLPYFRWDKSVLETGKRSETAYNLPPGPNNPVGIVWLAINIPSRGMHGTAAPDQIGRNSSAGCVRLANWDAWELAQRAKAGTPVIVK